MGLLVVYLHAEEKRPHLREGAADRVCQRADGIVEYPQVLPPVDLHTISYPYSLPARAAVGLYASSLHKKLIAGIAMHLTIS